HWREFPEQLGRRADCQKVLLSQGASRCRCPAGRSRPCPRPTADTKPAVSQPRSLRSRGRRKVDPAACLVPIETAFACLRLYLVWMAKKLIGNPALPAPHKAGGISDACLNQEERGPSTRIVAGEWARGPAMQRFEARQSPDIEGFKIPD